MSTEEEGILEGSRKGQGVENSAASLPIRGQGFHQHFMVHVHQRPEFVIVTSSCISELAFCLRISVPFSFSIAGKYDSNIFLSIQYQPLKKSIHT